MSNSQIEPHSDRTEYKVWFQAVFCTVHHELREMTDLTVQNMVMHHANMVYYMVAVLQEVLQKQKSLIQNPVTVHEPHEHGENDVQITQQQLTAQLHQMQTMMLSIQLQYYSSHQPTYQYYLGHGNYRGNINYRCQGERGTQQQINLQVVHDGHVSSDLKQYCWKNRMCVHPGTDCRTHAQGHKNNTAW